MFPNRIGALVLDGMEYVRDDWEPWGWGLSSLDNVTDAFEDGFVGECVRAGPASCALATSDPPSGDQYECARATLSKQVRDIFEATRRRPIPGVSSQGPGIVTYEHLVEWLYSTLYHPGDWKEAAETLARLKEGNATLALDAIHRAQFSYNPTRASPEDEVFPSHYSRRYPESSELQTFVICASVPPAFLLQTTDREIGRLLRCGEEVIGLVERSSPGDDQQILDIWEPNVVHCPGMSPLRLGARRGVSRELHAFPTSPTPANRVAICLCFLSTPFVFADDALLGSGDAAEKRATAGSRDGEQCSIE